MASGTWKLRAVPPVLAQRYLDEGWWDDRSLGDLVAAGLAADRPAAVIHANLMQG